MKNVKLFYLRECPFCKKALRYIDELKAKYPELRGVEIELIEESDQADSANKYDYHYVPTFYIDGVKVVGGMVMEPVRPRITEKGYADWDEHSRPEYTDETYKMIQEHNSRSKK